MISLEKTSGLPLELDEKTFKLRFNPPLKEVTSSVRTLTEMAPVLMDKDAKPKPELEALYYMHRDVYLPEHEALIHKDNLRYDITVIPAATVGKEFNKTLGHYHANIPGTNVAHPEMCEVLSGKALFVIQKMDTEFKNLITVLAVEADVGDKVIYPPNYGHIIVNKGSEVLVTANWVSRDYKALYEPIQEKHGMAYYVVKGKKGEPVFVKNENYHNHPQVRKIVIADKIRSAFGFDSSKPMYLEGMKNPKLIEFLNHPSKYAVELSTISS